MTTPSSPDDEPLREGSTSMAMLYTLRKTYIKLVCREAAHARFAVIKTRGHARQYIEEIMPLLLKEHEAHRLRRMHKQSASP